MKQLELTRWLKLIIVFAALIGLFLCFVFVPVFGIQVVEEYPELSYMFWPCLIYIWATAVPFYIALYKVWQIVKEISKDNSFCLKNAMALRSIGILALLDSFLYFVGMIILSSLNILQPTIGLAMLIIVFIGIAIGIVSFTLSRLVRKASDIKEENDLTI
ncbi:MAG: DUF2975 domain-containing protein [Tissierellia bacterium]|nr:DUF2975 domain-containing protein [Tissierellia bacterium]